MSVQSAQRRASVREHTVTSAREQVRFEGGSNREANTARGFESAGVGRLPRLRGHARWCCMLTSSYVPSMS